MYRTTQKLEKQNSYTLLLTNFILSADVLSKNVTAFYIQSLLVYILYWWSLTPWIWSIIDWNVSEFWEIVRNKYYINMIAFVDFIVWIIYLSRDMKDIPDYYNMATRTA